MSWAVEVFKGVKWEVTVVVALTLDVLGVEELVGREKREVFPPWVLSSRAALRVDQNGKKMVRPFQDYVPNQKY